MNPQLDQNPPLGGMEPMRLLLIEDDHETAAFVKEGLSGEAHEVHIVADGRAALVLAAAETWDVLIVDRMLPGLDGLSIVRMLRGAGILTPVLFLTTLDGIDDRVDGLNAGADDYVVKPFALAELVARVAALGRRRQVAADAPTVRLRVADLEVDLLTRTVSRGGIALALQPREFRLLEYLLQHEGEVVTRTMLLEQVWNFHFDPNTNIVESHLSRLRDKLGRDKPELIHTVRGAGYVLRAPTTK